MKERWEGRRERETEEGGGIGYSGALDLSAMSHLCECWVLNLCPLEEHVLLTTKLSPVQGLILEGSFKVSMVLTQLALLW